MTGQDYRNGLVHGARLSEYEYLVEHEPALRLEVQLIGTSNRRHRAFALGALRGYRQATGRPHTITGHKVRT